MQCLCTNIFFFYFRFCPEKYYPLDPDVLDKYVVGDDYLPTWEVPSLRKYYIDLGFSMKESLNAYLRDIGKYLILQYITNMSSKLSQVVMFLTYTWEVPSLNLSQETKFFMVFCSLFRQVLDHRQTEDKSMNSVCRQSQDF